MYVCVLSVSISMRTIGLEKKPIIYIIQLMTFHKVDTLIYQPRGSDVHRSQGLR